MFLCMMQMVNTMLKDVRRPPGRGEPCGDPFFEGVKRADWRARPHRARALGVALAERGEIAYWAPSDAASEATAAENRFVAHDRCWLRSAKPLEAAYVFLVERQTCDQPKPGLRLILVRNIKLLWRAAASYRRDLRGARRANRVAERPSAWRPSAGKRAGGSVHAMGPQCA